MSWFWLRRGLVEVGRTLEVGWRLVEFARRLVKVERRLMEDERSLVEVVPCCVGLYKRNNADGGS